MKLPPLASEHFRTSTRVIGPRENCSDPIGPAASEIHLSAKEVQIASFDRGMRPLQRKPSGDRQIKSLNRRPQRKQRNAECFASLAAFCRASVVHSLYSKAHALSREVIGAAIEVHRLKGPGLIEGIYEKCLVRELDLRSISCICQRHIQIEYKGLIFEEPLRLDVLVEECLLLELKSVQEVVPIHKAQLLSYMRLLDLPLGLLINFHQIKLTDGVHRMILPGADR